VQVKVLLADDSDIIRKSIRGLLLDHAQLQLVGEARDFPEAIRLAKELQPNVIVVDLHMPNASNSETPDLKIHLNPSGRLLAISASNDQDSKSLAVALGADTFLDKMDLYDKLIPAILHLASPAATNVIS
jgi:two-component system nitrate/nitrite response regulator NarL